MTSHLWESTLFAAVVGLLTLAVRRNPARVRHWLWLAASLKFLIPFSLLVGLGSHFGFRSAAPPQVFYAVEDVRQQLSAPEIHFAPRAASSVDWLAIGETVWIGGCAVVLFLWGVRWWRVRSIVRAAAPLHLNVAIEARSSRALLEPGVFGIWRPVLLLPDGIAERLTAEQLDAIVAHELCHVRRRDNLAAAIHMVVEALFWFHPLVWWIGARMVEERERACDEEVLGMGKEPEVYAESILKVCRFYVESPLECVAGVTGSDLKKRIEQIMMNPLARSLDLGRKALLLGVGFAAVAGPLVVGMMNAPAIRAQSDGSSAARFEAVAIHPAVQDGDQSSGSDKSHFTVHNLTLKQLISEAYDNTDMRLISGGPKWMDSERYDINAKIPEEFAQKIHDLLPPMYRNLLTDRFQLTIHREPAQVSGFALVVAKNGPTMAHANPDERGVKLRTKNTHFVAECIDMEGFAKYLSRRRDVGKLVADKTGLPGWFKFELDWAPDRGASSPDASSDDRPSIFTALQQLGLKLETAKIPVSTIVIDRAEKPSEN